PDARLRDSAGRACAPGEGPSRASRSRRRRRSMNRRAVLVAVCMGAALVTTAVSGAAPGPPTLPPPTVTVEGAPGNGLIPFDPLTLTVAQLAALPQQQITVTIGGHATAEEGPLVSALLTQAGFQTIPGCKNDELRYWVEASSLTGAAAEITA